MIRVILCGLLSFNMAFLNPSTASAGLLTVQELTQRGGTLSSQILNEIEKPEAQARLSALGISSAEAKSRIAALSDEEIREMIRAGGAQQAGGDVVIGLTTVLLIIIIILLIRR